MGFLVLNTQTFDGDFYRDVSYVQSRLPFWRLGIGYILKLYCISGLLFKADILGICNLEVFAALSPSTNSYFL